MSTRKVRCSYCKRYFLREECLRIGIQAFCSHEHYQNYRNDQVKKQRAKQQKNQLDPKIKSAVIHADGERCRFCGTKFNLHVHHIKYRSEGGTDTMGNLITLCVEHHGTVHSDKGKYQKLCFDIVDLRENHGDKRTRILE